MSQGSSVHVAERKNLGVKSKNLHQIYFKIVSKQSTLSSCFLDSHNNIREVR